MTPRALVPSKWLVLVEDDLAIRDAMSDCLEEEGFRVLSTAHGAQALTLLEGLRDPAVVVLDLLMPVMDGFEFLRQLRARPWLHHHRVLLVSAAKFTAELGREAGVVGFLEKPFDLDRLVSVARAEMGA